MIRISLCLAALVAMAMTGCQNDDDGMARSDTVYPDSSADTASMAEPGLQSSALGGIPPEVQQQILTDLSGMEIASSDIQTGDTGVLYRVTYYENGQMMSRTYDRDGIAVVLPGDREAAEATAENQSDPADEPIEQRLPDSPPAQSPPTTRPDGGGN